MRTAEDCLKKALDLEHQARLCRTPGHVAELIAMAAAWRRLAQQALWQDATIIPRDPSLKPDNDTGSKAS